MTLRRWARAFSTDTPPLPDAADVRSSGQHYWARRTSPAEERRNSPTLVYDHHTRELSDRLTHVQHDHCDAILSTLHVHLDHDNSLEVIAVRGNASLVQKIADTLIGTRGVKHGRLAATTTGRRLT